MLRSCILFILVFSTSVAVSQHIVGTVTDDITGEKIEGITVILGDSLYQTESNVWGVFDFADIEPGRYKITASHTEYEDAVVFNIWVRNGKVITQDLIMSKKSGRLLTPGIFETYDLSEIGAMVISEEQLNRFPATYFDPARQVLFAPDLTAVNDRNNRVSVRGISPEYNTWRLQGVEIVNPNHLSYEGTFAEQPVSTGGGINMLSAQVLDKSSFLYGGYSADYGNSNGGIFDMRLKKGSAWEHQHTAQASLIGFDFSTEGPFKKGGDASYILNYRSSLGGLLSAFNISFDGESTGFHDLIFNLNKPLGDKANFAVFGVGGLSSNRTQSKELEESTNVKDRSDRIYKGRTGVFGSTLDWRIGNGILKLSAALSGRSNDLSQFTFSIPSRGFGFRPGYDNNSTNLERSIISTNVSYRFKFLTSIIHVGSMNNYYANRYIYRYGSFPASTKYEARYVNPYINTEFPITKAILFEAGVNINLPRWFINERTIRQNGFNIELLSKSYEQQAIDPRIKLTIGSGDNSRLYLSFGRYSQLLDHSNYFFVFEQNAGEFAEVNREYQLQQSYRYILGVSGRNSVRRVSVELFYNHYPETFIGSFGAFNFLQISPVNTVEVSSAQTYGISMMGSRSFADSWYSQVGGSVINSTWGGDQPNRFNSRFNFNISGGKEWKYQRNGTLEMINMSANGIFQDGLKEPGELALVVTNNEVFYRIDLKIQFTRVLEKRTTSISLDLQNVTFRRNDAFRVDDPFQIYPAIEQQMGFTPLLTYRIEF